MKTNELNILKTALLNEEEGSNFYQLAADNAVDPDVRNAFLSLAKEEKLHSKWLLDLMQSINKRETPSLDLSESDAVSPQIFNLSKASGKQNIMEVSVFHIGILMEKASMDYYRKAAGETDIPEAKKLYDTLAKWELQHLEQLEKVYDALSDNWFEQQGFSPA